MVRAIFAATAITAAAFGAASPADAKPTTPTPTPPPGPTAICNDGTPSYSQHRSGTCSHHGGVRQWCPCDSGADQSIVGLYDDSHGIIAARRIEVNVRLNSFAEWRILSALNAQ